MTLPRLGQVTVLVLAAAEVSQPARLVGGRAEGLPHGVLDGGEVLLEVSVNRAGSVAAAKVLRDTPPFTDLLAQSVRTWRFSPARDRGRPVPARLLVAGLFLPHALAGTTGPSTRPRDVAPASPDVPFPTLMIPPVYPSHGEGDAVVLVEMTVLADGSVGDAQVVGAASDFDDDAVFAVRQWRFDARSSRPLPVGVYAVLGLRPSIAVRTAGTAASP